MTDEELTAYRAMSPYEKAAHEAALWEKRARDTSERRTENGKTYGIASLARILPSSVYEIRHRNALWLAGDIAFPLWARLERGTLTLAECVRYLRQAERERKQTRGNVSVRLAQLLGASVTVLHPVLVQPSEAHPPPMEREAFLSGVRALVGAYAAHALGTVDKVTAARLRKILEADIALAVSAFHAKVRAESGSEDLAVCAPRRRTLVEACRTLSMDPPRVGKPVNAALVKKQYRALARLFHPDVSDAPNAAEVFDNATTAYNTICDYNISLESEHAHGSQGQHQGE